MKKAVLLHGTDGSPDFIWFPWLKKQLESRGYDVWAPSLPDNHTPNRKTYNDFLFGSNWDFSDNLVIGHSSGAVSILNLLMDARCPKIATGILVGAWSKTEDTILDMAQFKDLFPAEGFDFDTINSKADKLIFIHGDNDPFCPLDQAKWLAEQTSSKILVIPGGHHLGKTKGKEFPELLEVIETSL